MGCHLYAPDEKKATDYPVSNNRVSDSRTLYPRKRLLKDARSMAVFEE
nr:hypothetical protein [Tanacetum cinerariifolium]